ncbi:MAG TPA: ABC transporter permease [Gaiellaceae bacterium]|nr:ABC transporter permease [Gaiellaceae bacterium]
MHRTGWQALSRIGTSAVAFCAVTLLVFMAFYAAPTQQPFSRRATQHVVLDRSFRGYLHYLWRFVSHGDLGRSLSNREAVTTRLFRALPVTLSVLAGGLVISLFFALVPLLRPRARLDRAFALFALAGVSVHPVWVSLVSSWLFGAHWHLVADQGYCGITSAATGCSGVSHWASHMVLPWAVYGLATGAYFALAVRVLVRHELDQDYVRWARAKGLGDARIMRAHVLRNITPQLLGLFVTNVGFGLGSLLFIEQVFGLPGLGNLFLVALRQHDVPVTAGIVMLATTSVLVLTLLVDLIALALEPRARLRRRDRLADHEHVEQLRGELGIARVR